MFWQLTKTHTGLKLLKEKGHFNILEECEVLAVQVMPDGKVSSVFDSSLNSNWQTNPTQLEHKLILVDKFRFPENHSSFLI